ncbi:MAG TPA: hypothetical protein PK014_14385 [Thermoanaerobaculia bacterium]|nr:hypothetical protein [Thermoanaerobaculia bacterium]HUM31235.1 hypothetical protein [Thermoanaerobaculia bacterium]HXK69589.1 hypothetical protein [Thermoanaerobaculia bacterium]
MEAKPKSSVFQDGWFIMALLWPIGVSGILILLWYLFGKSDLGFEENWQLAVDFFEESIFIIVFFLNVLFVRSLYRQKHTYAPLTFPKNPLWIIPLLLYFVITFSIFFITMGMMVGIFAGAPPLGLAAFLVRLGLKAGEGFTFMKVLAILFSILCIPVLFATVSVFSRIQWALGVRRQIRSLATSKIRSAAMGLVELHGTVCHAENRPKECPILGHSPLYDDLQVYHNEPFLIEDETGSIRVEPPEGNDTMNPRYALNPHPVHGLRVLMDGEEVHLIGYLGLPDGEGKDPVIKPWIPPYGRWYLRLVDIFGRPGKILRFLAPTDLFLVAVGEERKALRRLFLHQVLWIFLGVVFAVGVAVSLTISISQMLGYAILT